jgi:hypothetical protein
MDIASNGLETVEFLPLYMSQRYRETLEECFVR